MIEILLLVLAVSVDSFVTAFSYGISKIKITLLPSLIISGVGCAFLSLAMFFAQIVSSFIPQNTGKITSIILLMIIGIVSVFGDFIKSILKKNKGKKQLGFNYSGVNFVVSLYLDETTADIDGSKTLSIREALFLAVALSADSIVTGFSAGLSSSNKLITVGVAFILGIVAVLLGNSFARLFWKNKRWNVSYISGIVLIILAIVKII